MPMQKRASTKVKQKSHRGGGGGPKKFTFCNGERKQSNDWKGGDEKRQGGSSPSIGEKQGDGLKI